MRQPLCVSFEMNSMGDITGGGLIPYKDYSLTKIHFLESIERAMLSRETESKAKGARGNPSEAFPPRLHAMLAATTREGFQDCVRWQEHGRCFVVCNPDKFVKEVLPRYFRQTKMASFKRQLNIYGFVRLKKGPDAGGFYHQLFLRSRPDLCQFIHRDLQTIPGPSTEPNLYKLPPCGHPEESEDSTPPTASSKANAAPVIDTTASRTQRAKNKPSQDSTEDSLFEPLDQTPEGSFPTPPLGYGRWLAASSLAPTRSFAQLRSPLVSQPRLSERKTHVHQQLRRHSPQSETDLDAHCSESSAASRRLATQSTPETSQVRLLQLGMSSKTVQHTEVIPLEDVSLPSDSLDPYHSEHAESTKRSIFERSKYSLTDLCLSSTFFLGCHRHVSTAGTMFPSERTQAIENTEHRVNLPVVNPAAPSPSTPQNSQDISDAWRELEPTPLTEQELERCRQVRAASRQQRHHSKDLPHPPNHHR